MPGPGKLYNLLHRLRGPSAWSDQTRDVVRSYLSQGRLAHRLTLHSSVAELNDDEIQEHYHALESLISRLQGVPIYRGSRYSSSSGKARFTKRVFQVGQNHLEAELMTSNGFSRSQRSIQVDITGHLYQEVEEIMATLLPWVRERPAIQTTSQVYTLVQVQDEVVIRSLGKTEVDMEPGNYDPDVVARYQHITKCLSSAEPCGRFCLFDGPPGTGKSYLIRSLISTLDAVFILIPSTMIGALSGPSLMPTFLKAKANKKPLVLVLEDADMALVSRKVSRGNSAALAEILNLSDGLIGEMLDLRIIATTNAERIELDPAVTRPGRMCTHLTLGELPAAQLASIYNRLSESDQGADAVQKAHAKTLAEVYRLARDTTWAAEVPKTEKTNGTYL